MSPPPPAHAGQQGETTASPTDWGRASHGASGEARWGGNVTGKMMRQGSFRSGWRPGPGWEFEGRCEA